MAELVTIYGLLRMLATVDREILNAGSSPVLTTNMDTLMEGGNKTHNMVRSGVTEWLMAPLAGLGSSPVLTTKNKNMIVLIMFIGVAIGFAWAIPQEEIDELKNRFEK